MMLGCNINFQRVTELCRPDQSCLRTELGFKKYSFVAYIECKLSTNILEKCKEVMSMEHQSLLKSKTILKLLGEDEIA